MKILKLSPYYYPEQISSSHLDKDLTEAMMKEGFYIENFVPTPSRNVSDELIEKYSKIKYEELENGHMIIHRFPMFREGKNVLQRAIRYILVNIIQYFKGINAKNIDLIYAGSTPPTQGLLCALVKKSLKVPFVYNLQDIFPDSLVNAKMTKEGSLIWKIGRWIENFTYRNADKIIVISEDFKQNIMKKGVPENKIVVIPNWVNTDNVYPVDRKDNVLFDRYNLDRDKFYICYSGNIGHSQNMELLVEVACEIKNTLPDVRFVIIGEGAAKQDLLKAINENHLDNIIVLPFQPYEDIAHVFSLGDVGLIISKPGIGGSSVPSKTWSIMAAQRPILASFDEDSELCKLVNMVECGVVLKNCSCNEFVNKIEFLKLNEKQSNKFGANGRQYVTTVISKTNCVNRYIDVFKNIFN